MLTGVFGAAGEAGAVAGDKTDRFTGEGPDPWLSRVSTAAIRLSPTACASTAARVGDSSDAVMVMITVFASARASIFEASAVGDWPKLRLSMTGCRTNGVLAVSI